MRFVKLVLFWVFSVSLCWAAVPTKDLPKAKDPAGLPRYADSVIFGYQFADFDESTLPLGQGFHQGRSAWLRQDFARRGQAHPGSLSCTGGPFLVGGDAQLYRSACSGGLQALV